MENRGWLFPMAQYHSCNALTEFYQVMSEPINLETFPNPRMGRDYEIEINCPEFTSVCPITGHPDFGNINVKYCPDRLCLELKALKYYLQSYRNRGIFYEEATNQILDDLSAACSPKTMTITSSFTARGGITTNVTVKYQCSR